MAKVFDGITPALASWLTAQPVFFVGTAPLASDGHVNLSPKGLDGTFAILSPSSVAYLDLTGSGVETIAHLREPGNGRICLMFCAFSGRPRIVRLHGRGTVVPVDAPSFPALAKAFPPEASSLAGVRSIIQVDVTRTSDSCGFGVPRMTFDAPRDELLTWADRKGADGIAEYRATRNAASIDGLPGFAPAAVAAPAGPPPAGERPGASSLAVWPGGALSRRRWRRRCRPSWRRTRRSRTPSPARPPTGRRRRAGGP